MGNKTQQLPRTQKKHKAHTRTQQPHLQLERVHFGDKRGVRRRGVVSAAVLRRVGKCQKALGERFEERRAAARGDVGHARQQARGDGLLLLGLASSRLAGGRGAGRHGDVFVCF